MSKKSNFIFIAGLALGTLAFFAFKIYTKDKILSFESDIGKRSDEKVFLDYLNSHDKRSTFLDIGLNKAQKEEFLNEMNRSNYIHLRSYDPKRYEYIFIVDEDGDKNLIFDQNSSRLKGIFTIKLEQNSDNKRFIYLRSISPKELNILKKSELNKNN